MFYDKGSYWPSHIESIREDEILHWLENIIWLIPLSPRESNFDVLADTNINEASVKNLSLAADKVWSAILKKNIIELGEAFTKSFEAQIAMFPNMVTSEMNQQINTYKNEVSGYKVSGAGGGGYLILLCENRIDKAIQIKIRR